MAKTSAVQISPPLPEDKESLKDFAAVVSRAFEDLYQDSHVHSIRSTFPSKNDGAATDVVLVDTGSAVNLCVKTTRGWFKVALTAVS